MSAVLPSPTPLRWGLRWESLFARAGLVVAALALSFTLASPLLMILVKSVQDKNGKWIGLAGFARYLATPSLLGSIGHSLTS